MDLGLDPAHDELPDLRPLLDTDSAQEALTGVLDEFRGSDGPLSIGALSDEELFACLASEAHVQPQGEWFSGLTSAQRRTARTAALRSLTTRGEVMVGSDEDGDVGARMSLRLMALLRLRRDPILLSARGMTRQGPSWYLLRRHGDVWMREIVSEHGYHSHDLVRLDDTEEVFFRMFAALGDQQHPSRVSLRHEGGVPMSMAVRAFLADQRHVTQLAMVHPGQDDPESFVICVDHDEAMTIGVPQGEDLVYSGGAASAVLERWRAWREQW